MANESKKLEERLQELGSRLASPHGSAEELFSLLDTTDGVLSSVEQSPSESMLTALKPLMSALVAEELLRHSDTDVKVAVASCVSEITRITAPEALYEDDIMKEIFQMIVGAFEGLYDTSDRSFTKRVSILETVAKVRSCVVMLDLECDALILEMFHHFLKTISLNHSENVFSSMETIMSLVIEESEEISPELLSCLLDVVKKDNKDVLPITQKLVEQVMGDCATKLKPCLVEFVQATGASLSDYNKVVSSICHENSDALENTETNTSGETVAEDSKLSERTVSDEMLQLEQEVGSPEKDGVVADNSPKVALSNGTFQLGNGDSIAQPVSPKQMPERSRRSGQSKDAIAASLADDGNVESAARKPDGISDLNAKKGKDRKTNSSAQLTDTADHSRVENDKEAPAVSSRRQGQSEEADHSQVVDLSAKEDVAAVPLDPDASNGQQNNSLLENSTPQGTSQAPSEILPVSTRSKRGRPAGRKSTTKQNDGDAVDHQFPSASGQKDSLANRQTQDEEILPKDNKSKKEHESINDSEGKSRSQAGKKSQLKTAADDEAPAVVTSDVEIKAQRHSGKKGVKRKVFHRESSGKKHKSNVKQKEQVSLEENATGEPSSKEIVSSPRTATNATSIDQSQLEESKKPASRRKRSQGTEEIPETSDRKKMGDEIVGSRIKVWWPDDQKFYDGVIDSFDHTTKKHKVVYTDGDIEVLLLSKERWEFTGGDIEGKEKDPEDTDAPQMTRTKTTRGTPNSLSKQAKTTLQLKSGAESNDKTGKRLKGRPQSGASNLEKVDGSSVTSRKSKARAVVSDKGKTPTSSGKLKDEPEKSGSMDATTKTSLPGKTGDGSKDDTNNLGGKTKGDTAKISGSSKHVPARSGRKSKTPKSEEETSKSGGKSGYDDSKSCEVTPKTGTRSEVDVVGAGTQPKKQTSRTKKLKKSVSQAPNGAASKEKAKLQENDNIAEAKDGASSGTKRGRKRRKTSQN